MPSPEASLSHQPATGQTRKLSPFLRRITPGGCAEAVPPLPAPRRPQWMPVDIYVPGAELVGRMPLGAPSHRPHQTGPCKERLGLLRKMTLAFPVVQQGDSDTLWPLTDPGVTVSDSLTWRYMRHFKMLLEKWTLLLETSAELQLST
ncbi:uncharacterized protein LOC107519421 isoform X3 [Rousettus aegyptiacus]|uniref:uncharacterized protein LOC107519421 isoform X3 n=1 Tax=Rousettus aegyptiacus TaxID=9407 RepID=UPI00168D8FAF|nr:uncharacterized protein LOC107519421 isoform X3 [Rousettus aegyptiacus]